MWVELAYPGVRGQLHWNMNADSCQMVWTIDEVYRKAGLSPRG